METLTETAQKKTIKLGRDIAACLSCDINGTGLPCRTCRFKAMGLMVEYLKINCNLKDKEGRDSDRGL